MKRHIGKLLFIGIWSVYLFLQSKGIYGGDAGDLATAAYVWGIPHPSGYPFYTLLGAILIRIIPFYTVAWRVGIISSLFAALSVSLFFSILKRITNNDILSLIGSLILAFLYPFWLYAEVVEIFSLSVFIILSLILLALKYKDNYQWKYLYLFALLLGLTFSHHHIIIFLFPALIILFWRARDKIRKRVNLFRLKRIALFFLLGLTPLLYIPISASFYPPIDWEHPTSIGAFLSLFFRTAYGTFKAGPFIFDNPMIRLFSTMGFFRFFLIDLKTIGLGLMLLGFLESYRKKEFFWVLLSGFLSFLFFLYYASFPQGDPFSLATFERFIIFSYLFSVIYITLGIELLLKLFYRFSILLLRNKRLGGYLRIAPFLFLIYPISLFTRNLPQIYSIRDDRSGEILAEDLLKSAPKDSLVLLIDDTATFNTQYIYYTGHLQNKVKLVPIQLYKLFRSYYQEGLKRSYPQIVIPKVNNPNSAEFIIRFIDLNSRSMPVMTNFVLPNILGNLSPRGLLWQYFPTGDKTSLSDIMAINEKLWNSYQEPDAHNIIYKNLFLQDILRDYSTAHQNYANFLLQNEKTSEAISHLNEAKNLTPDDADIYLLFGKVYTQLGECKKAEDAYIVLKSNYPGSKDVYKQLIELAKKCFKDDVKAQKYADELKKLEDAAKPKAANL